MNKKESFDQKQCNYKLYKAKKQWITACATVIVALGASAFISTNVSADMTSNSTNQVVEENANSAVSIVSNDSSKVDTVTGSNDNVLTQEDSDQDTTIELGGNEQTLYSGRAFGSTSEDEAQFDGSNFLDLKINNEEQNIDADFMNNTSNFTFTDQSGNAGVTPINAGSYTVSLSQQGLDSLRQLFPSITLPGNPDDIKSEARFVINQITPTVTLSGNNKMVYSGKPVSLADINSGGNISVQITLPIYDENGQQLKINYKLQDGDYIWPEEVDPSQAPKDVKQGSNQYQLELNPTQKTLDHLNKAILSKYPQLEGNYDLTTSNLGTIQTYDDYFEITPAPAKLTQSGLAGKVYDGTPGSVSQDQMIKGLKD